MYPDWQFLILCRGQLHELEGFGLCNLVKILGDKREQVQEQAQ